MRQASPLALDAEPVLARDIPALRDSAASVGDSIRGRAFYVWSAVHRGMDHALSRVLDSADAERSVAHMLYLSGHDSEEGYGRYDFAEARLDELVDASKADPLDLLPAVTLETKYMAQTGAKREERQAVADAYRAAAKSCNARGVRTLESQCLAAAAQFTTAGDAKDLLDAAVTAFLDADLGPRDPASIMWAVRTLSRRKKQVSDELREKIVAKLEGEAKQMLGKTESFDYFIEPALELTHAQATRERLWRTQVDHLAAAAAAHKDGLMRQHWLMEAARVATEKLHDRDLAGQFLERHDEVDPTEYMGLIEQELDIAPYLARKKQNIAELLARVDPDAGPNQALEAFVYAYAQIPLMPMQAADDPGSGEASLGDLFSTTYFLGDKNVRTPKSQPPQLVRINRSIAYQCLHYEALATFIDTDPKLLPRMLDVIVEWRADPQMDPRLVALDGVIKAWLRGEWHTCIVLGCVAAEGLLQRTWRLGKKNPRYVRAEGTQISILSGLLADEVVDQVLGSQVARHLRYLFDDEDGPNLRNIALHGSLDPKKASHGIAAHVAHLVLTTAAITIFFESAGTNPETYKASGGDESKGAPDVAGE